MVANVLASVKTISETFVATEYRPTLAAATNAGSIATSSRPVTWLATVAPCPRSPNQSVLRPSPKSAGPNPILRTDRHIPTTSTSPVAAAGAIRAVRTVSSPSGQRTTKAAAMSAGWARRSAL